MDGIRAKSSERFDPRTDRYKCPCCGVNFIDPRLVAKVDEIERQVGEKLIVTSGYRCEKHNRTEEVGGSSTSSHLKGLAVDVACDQSRLRFKLLSTAICLGFTRIGVKQDFIHLDIDRQKDARVVWL